MLSKTVLVDQKNNELECYLDKDNAVQIYVGSHDDEQSWSGILLDKDGVEKLIKALSELKEGMQ